MENYIIIAVLIVLIFFCVRSSIKHFRGEGGCCGGGDYKAKKKKLSSVAAKKTFAVEGMSCQHCVNRVMEAVNSIPGASADVRLKKGLVVVSMETPIEDAVLIKAIEGAGYQATSLPSR